MVKKNLIAYYWWNYLNSTLPAVNVQLWTYKKSPHFTAKIAHFTTENRKSCKNSPRMLYIKQSEFYLSSKQTYWNLLRDAAVEKEVDVLQEVKGSKPCKGGEILCFFVSSAITIVVKFNNFTNHTTFNWNLKNLGFP